ncbi:MAG: hypothetical protein CEN90_695 [Parcubacteria group bacterium Licking1014_17]|nr:MAG: hypothetical protein CEN90_695 [Parcubacteria group bacterium Licking1014_17]
MLVWKTTLFKVAALGLAVAGVFLYLFFAFRNENSPVLKNNSQGAGNFKVLPLSQGFSLLGAQIGDALESGGLKSLPPPEDFRHFDYPKDSFFDYPKNILNVSGKCNDFYKTVLIYGADSDYRQNPEMAKFNEALRCKKGEMFEEKIDLSLLNITEGGYYVIVADQGKEGSWYNPK